LSRLPPPDVPLLWPAPLRTALLQGSSAHAAAEQQVALSDAFHAALKEHSTPAGGVVPESGSFRWAQALLLSRAHSGDGKPLALVPGLDLLNHGGALASADVRFDEASAAFQLVARRTLHASEELTIDYGTDASHRLLRLYGFVGGTAADDVTADGGELAAPPPGDEVMLQLLPPAAKVAEAPEATRRVWLEQRAALGACGLGGSTLRLGVDADGQVPLTLTPAGHADRAAQETALLVIATAIDSQLQRQADGRAAAHAVQAA